ncbi:MAG: M28 family peptidase [Planctomycetota bacterium]
MKLPSCRSSVIAVLFGFLIPLAPCQSVVGQATTEVPPAGVPAANEPQAITNSLRADIGFLASDDLRGRSVTDETIHVAADYIVKRMNAIGLETDAVDGGALQSVETPVGSEARNAQRNFCKVELGDETIEATLEDGFGPLALGIQSGEATGPLIFVGYGITANEFGFDDYAGIDAQGATVIVLRKEPGANDPDSPFNGTENSRHAFFATKVINAISHGAAAVLIVNDPGSTRSAVQEVQNRINREANRKQRLERMIQTLPPELKKNRAAAEEQIAVAERLMDSEQDALRIAARGIIGVGNAGPASPQTSKLPVGSIARDVVDRLLKANGQSLKDLEAQIDETYQPASVVISNAKATVSVDMKPGVAVSDNVIGVLPGKGDLAGETLIVGSHYDHVGMGGVGSLAPGTIAVHNGADDNASGTAMMLACAAEMKRRLASIDSHREIHFIAFTAEERGLIGSARYVTDPIKPLAQAAAMINLDMVGRIKDNELNVYGTGSATGLESLLDSTNEDFGFDLFKVASGYGPSDHQSFYRARVPVLFFFTGLHNDYHRPSDDVDKIDFDEMTRVAEMVCAVAYRLGTQAERPEYLETNRTPVRPRRQMTAYLGVQLSANAGVRVVSITEGSAAEQAGLQPNDIIKRVDGAAINVPDDLVRWVRNHSADHRFEMRVQRGGNVITLKGTLQPRPE